MSVYSRKSFDYHRQRIVQAVDAFGKSRNGSDDGYRACLVRMINCLADGESLEEAKKKLEAIYRPDDGKSPANHYAIAHSETVGNVIKLINDNIRVRKAMAKNKDR